MGKKPPIEPDANNKLPPLSDEFKEQLLRGLPKAARGIFENMVRNGLGGALGYPGSGGIGNPGSPYSEQVSQTTTLFKNLRWYLVSNFRQLLSEAFVEIGLIQTICRVPVDDALRGGVEVKSKQLSEDQVQELQVSLDRDDDLNTVGQACVWNRLFGGAGIIILTDQDPTEEFSLDAITKDSPLEFRAVDMWELFWDQQNTEGYEPEASGEDFDFYNYYAIKLHKSRVMRLKGMTAPSFIRPRLRGWGFSVVEALVRSINQYLKATDLGFEVLDEFKLDIYKIKNLVTTLMSPGGQQAVQQRIQLANWQKNYQNALVMDSEDDFGQKQLSFAGLAETMGQIRMQVAADMRMPVTKLFGSQGGGLNSDDETDLEVYNAMVESEVRNKIKYDILRICEIKCQKLFGMVPEDLSLDFKPLRMLSAVDEETVKTSKFARAHTAATTGLITPEEFRDIMNRDELLGIQLKANELSLLNPDEAAEGDQKPGDDVDDPGANREDTRKPDSQDPTQKKENKLRNWLLGKKRNESSGDWDESKHKRAADGKFGSGGGAATSAASKLEKAISHVEYLRSRTEAQLKDEYGDDWREHKHRAVDSIRDLELDVEDERRQSGEATEGIKIRKEAASGLQIKSARGSNLQKAETSIHKDGTVEVSFRDNNAEFFRPRPGEEDDDHPEWVEGKKEELAKRVTQWLGQRATEMDVRIKGQEKGWFSVYFSSKKK